MNILRSPETLFKNLCTDYEEENVRTEGISQIYLQNSEGGVQKKRGKKLAKEIDHDALAKNVVTSENNMSAFGPNDPGDPLCDPNAPRTIHFEDVTSAAFMIKHGILTTPCMKSQLSDMCGMELYLKKDFLQVTGSFKERGARYALMMLTEEQKKKGVISASLGNHALALCYHGKCLNIPVTVVMPIIAPIMKVQSCCNLNAVVVVRGKDMGEAKRIALEIAQEKQLLYINGYDHPHIMAGQGTLGLEIVEQVPDLDAVVVPVGGGGLIAGVSTAVKTLRPHGVETEKCPSFDAARISGKPISVPIQPTLADGLAVPTVGYNAFVTANRLIDKMVVVGEEWVAISILRLVEIEKSVVEGAGATGLAAILSGCLEELKGKKVVVLICGGNIDTTVLGRCLERGLAADGRLIKFSACVSDRPGGISDLCRLMADLGVSVKDIVHDRAWLTNDLFSVKVKVICETRDLDHSKQLIEVLKQNYDRVTFEDVPSPRKSLP
ncbi:hypothetical protein RUM44_002534 [Polyplax serrata]|uniref:L-serine deaminase n=1 Tax=Polyplax serrata TaxID=468196 RepID=A0ABR1AF21_POLSC